MQTKHSSAKRPLVVFLPALFALLFAAGACFAADYVPNEILVGLRSGGNRTTAESTMRQLGAITRKMDGIGAYSVRLNANQNLNAALATMQRRSEVLFAEPNYIVHAYSTPNDANYSAQYSLPLTSTDQAWAIWRPQATVVIAIVDTGILLTHPDLTNKIDRDSGNAVIGTNFVTTTAAPNDDNGHGTHVAGIAAAQSNNGIGVAGVAGWDGVAGDTDTTHIKLMPVKVLDSTGSGTVSAVASGVTWAADHGANVINLSLGSDYDSVTLSTAIAYAWNHGCIVVAAAGNSGSSRREYPAGDANVISVASSGSTDTLSYFSNYGNWVTVAAPGEQILSTTFDGGYGYMTGTSMASPFVAGEAALLWAQAPSLTNAQIANLVATSVDPLSPYRKHSLSSTSGRVNVFKALNSIANPGAPTLSSLSLGASTQLGSGTVTGTVSLTLPATGSGATVTLTSSNPTVVSVPGSINIPAGSSSAPFTVTVTSPKSVQTTTITATSGTTRTATLQTGPLLAGIRIGTVTSGTPVTATGTVTLNGPAPSSGITVQLASTDANVTVPATLTIPGGSSSGAFSITGNTGAVYPATVTATYDGVTVSASFSPKVARLIGFFVFPPYLRSGQSVTGFVFLNDVAPSGGAVVTLVSGNTTAVPLPATVTIPAGSQYALFTVTAGTVTSRSTVALQASYGGRTLSSYVEIRP